MPERRTQWAQAIILVLLYSFPAISSLRIASTTDYDVWWHLRAGEWIMQRRAVPHVDFFSSFTTGKPWLDYSWLFDVVITQLFQHLGFVGMAAYTTTMVLLITVAIHNMIRKLQGDFTYAVLLTAIACLSLSKLWTPRPWLFSILFFIWEIDLLMQARKLGRNRRLLWLPVVFLFWGNLHIQYIDGLAVLAIALAESALAGRGMAVKTQVRFGRLCWISGACVLATWINPYRWNVYRVAYDAATQAGVLNRVHEMEAMPFRDMFDWGVLTIALFAAGVLARVDRRSFFELALFVFAIYLSFRSLRDVWVVVIVGSAIVAAGVTGVDRNLLRVTKSFVPLVAASTVLLVFCGAWLLKVNNSWLSDKLSESFPSRAVEIVKEKGIRGPVYSDYNWGGYLIWSLRLPVSIDGRAVLQGDEHMERSIATWEGQPGWDSDPDLTKASVVIGPLKSSLGQVLRFDPRFELIFEDKLAVVFVSKKPATAEHTTLREMAVDRSTVEPTRD